MTELARNGVHARIIQQRDGNAFAILAARLTAARAAGWTDAQITAFLDRARAGDEDHLLRVVMQELDALRSESGSESVSGSGVPR